MSPKSRVRKKQPVPAASARRAGGISMRSYRRRKTLIRFGVLLMSAAAVLALVHVGAHFGAFGPAQPSGMTDMLFGWPTATVLFLAGAVMAGQTATPVIKRR